MNSSPRLISPNFRGLGGIWATLENSGNLGKALWNSVRLHMALNMNSMGIPGGFRGNTFFLLGKCGVGG